MSILKMLNKKLLNTVEEDEASNAVLPGVTPAYNSVRLVESNRCGREPAYGFVGSGELTNHSPSALLTASIMFEGFLLTVPPPMGRKAFGLRAAGFCVAAAL